MIESPSTITTIHVVGSGANSGTGTSAACDVTLERVGVRDLGIPLQDLLCTGGAGIADALPNDTFVLLSRCPVPLAKLPRDGTPVVPYCFRCSPLLIYRSDERNMGDFDGAISVLFQSPHYTRHALTATPYSIDNFVSGIPTAVFLARGRKPTKQEPIGENADVTITWPASETYAGGVNKIYDEVEEEDVITPLTACVAVYRWRAPDRRAWEFTCHANEGPGPYTGPTWALKSKKLHAGDSFVWTDSATGPDTPEGIEEVAAEVPELFHFSGCDFRSPGVRIIFQGRYGRQPIVIPQLKSFSGHRGDRRWESFSPITPTFVDLNKPVCSAGAIGGFIRPFAELARAFEAPSPCPLLAAGSVSNSWSEGDESSSVSLTWG